MPLHLSNPYTKFLLIPLCLLALLTCLTISDVYASTDAETVDEPPVLKPLRQSRAAELAETWATINENVASLQQLEEEIEATSASMRQVLERRTDTLFSRSIELSLEFCEQVADLHDAGFDVGEYRQHALGLIDEIPSGVERSIERLRARIEMPDFTKSALEQIAIDRKLVDATRLYRRMNMVLLDTSRIAARYDLDLADLKADTLDHLETSAINTSVFLDLAITEVRNLRTSLSVMPDDAELQAKLRVAEIRVREIIKLLTDNVESLRAADLPTAQYQRQLLVATGMVTTVSLDAKVWANVLQEWWHTALHFLKTEGPDFLFQALFFVLIVYGFYRLAGVVGWLVDRLLEARHVRLSRLMQQMIASIARSMTILWGLFIALSQFNVSVGPMLAGLGIAGFIIGFALQDSLSNFASGMMILFYKPFDVGDSVVAGGVRGKVSSMSLVNTTIRTFDNQSLIVPNNKIWQDVITNITDQHIRRIDMEFGITYDEDIERVETLLRDLLKEDPRVLKEPESRIMVGSFGDSSVNILCRPWVRTEDYWEVHWDLNKRVKQAFDREGITIPFPQRDVHLYTQPPAEENE